MDQQTTSQDSEVETIVGDPDPANDASRLITESLLSRIGDIAGSCKATAVFVYIDVLDGQGLDIGIPAGIRVFCVTRDSALKAEVPSACTQCLRIPDVPLTRMGQVKIAVFLALSKGLIKRGDRVVFLSGLTANKSLDTLIVTEVGREYEILASGDDLKDALPDIMPEVIERMVDIASELGSEGREGRPVGAMFIVGDSDKVLSMTRQLVLNPFKGYDPQERNVLDCSLEETVKELATIDGAFVLRGDGVIETCGAYVWTASHEKSNLPQGLGARHQAAAAITAVTDSIAITVSESTGSVTIFQGGRIITDIQKPRSTGDKPKLLRTHAKDDPRANAGANYIARMGNIGKAIFHHHEPPKGGVELAAPDRDSTTEDSVHRSWLRNIYCVIRRDAR